MAGVQRAADPVAAGELFEDVDFVVVRGPSGMHRPERRPLSPHGVQLGADLDAALLERHLARRGDFARREIVIAGLFTLHPKLEQAILYDAIGVQLLAQFAVRMRARAVEVVLHLGPRELVGPCDVAVHLEQLVERIRLFARAEVLRVDVGGAVRRLGLVRPLVERPARDVVGDAAEPVAVVPRLERVVGHRRRSRRGHRAAVLDLDPRKDRSVHLAERHRMRFREQVKRGKRQRHHASQGHFNHYSDSSLAKAVLKPTSDYTFCLDAER